MPQNKCIILGDFPFLLIERAASAALFVCKGVNNA